MMNLPVSRPLCYADNAGRSGDRRCWRATCQGIPRNGSSRRCVWDGELYYSSSPNTHRIESRQCLKKRKRNPVIPPDADYLNLFGKSPVPAEAIHRCVRHHSKGRPGEVHDTHLLARPTSQADVQTPYDPGLGTQNSASFVEAVSHANVAV